MSNDLLPLVPGEDAVPRVQDVVIGERLGLARPTNVRQTIEANRAELEAFGPLHAVNALVGIGSGAKRDITEYHLNEEQALLVCALSRTEKAAQVRRDLILTYTAYRRGQLGIPDEIRRTDGIARMLAHKVTGLEKTVGELVDIIKGVVVCADPRIAAVRYVPALQVAIDEGIPQKGRGGIVRQISRRLARYCASRGAVVLPDARGTALFPVEAVYAWLRDEGREFIKRRKAELAEPTPLFRSIPGGKGA